MVTAMKQSGRKVWPRIDLTTNLTKPNAARRRRGTWRRWRRRTSPTTVPGNDSMDSGETGWENLTLRGSAVVGYW